METELLDLASRLRRRQLGEDIACRLFAALLPKLVSAIRRAAAASAPPSAEPTVGAVAASLHSASAFVSEAAQCMFSLSHVAARALRVLAEEASRSAAAAGAAGGGAAAAQAPPSLREALERELALEAQPRAAPAAAPAPPLPADCAALPFTRQLEAAFLDGLSELQDELENVGAGLLPFVKDCLRPGESVVTAGGCPSLSAFLERAAARSSAEEPLRVLWVQGGAPGSGAPAAAREAAAHLAARAPAKARVALVPEACAWGALGAGAGVTKCLLPAALIARDGSALVGAGGLALALEAAARGIPVLLVASAARLSPAGSAREALAGASHPQAPPTGVLPLAEAGAVGACGALAVASAASQGSSAGGGGGGAPSVTVLNALFDVLEAPLVGLVVTSAGVAAPGGAWRLCSEAYGGGGSGAA